MEEKLDMMIAEFRETERELEQKSLASMNEFKWEMSVVQEKMVQQLSKKIGLSTYEFRRKGNKH